MILSPLHMILKGKTYIHVAIPVGIEKKIVSDFAHVPSEFIEYARSCPIWNKIILGSIMWA